MIHIVAHGNNCCEVYHLYWLVFWVIGSSSTNKEQAHCHHRHHTHNSDDHTLGTSVTGLVHRSVQEFGGAQVLESTGPNAQPQPRSLCWVVDKVIGQQLARPRESEPYFVNLRFFQRVLPWYNSFAENPWNDQVGSQHTAGPCDPK